MPRLSEHSGSYRRIERKRRVIQEIGHYEIKKARILKTISATQVNRTPLVTFAFNNETSAIASAVIKAIDLQLPTDIKKCIKNKDLYLSKSI